MAVKQKRQYDIRFVDTTTKSVIADDMKAVTKAFETGPKPLAQITLVTASIDDVSDDPIIPVGFTVLVQPQGAIDAKCYGAPNVGTVSDGDAVIFQAIEGTGYTFDGWYLGAGSTKLSSDLVTTLTVDAPAIAGQTVQFQARFVVTP